MVLENSINVLSNLSQNLSFIELIFYTAILQPFCLLKPFHGHFDVLKFSRPFSFQKLPHLRKVAVTAATWQHWLSLIGSDRGAHKNST
jgi:hypothetical protein